ncbi:hypothetical protein [Streptomyces hyaluromycini]|uniref:hypothetical protein n=1 Tax=Streptomyces hyaluromycini TaxID=1377993 RepID=UPI0011AEA921|nr:hypothetical protein [Streptomyces hyaluromycini]
MTNAFSIDSTPGLENAVNLEIYIPAEAWAALNNGESWVGHTANGEVESETIDINKVTIRLGG